VSLPLVVDGGACHRWSLCITLSSPPFRRIQKAQLAHQFPESRAAGSFKTVMCQSWLETATCKYGNDCKFAHGETELRYAR
jgi:hypothetical protein